MGVTCAGSSTSLGGLFVRSEMSLIHEVRNGFNQRHETDLWASFGGSEGKRNTMFDDETKESGGASTSGNLLRCSRFIK